MPIRETGVKAVFALACAAFFGSAATAECCKDPMNVNPSDITYRNLQSADIVLPTYNQQRLPDGRVQFDLRRRDINILKFFSAATMGLYGAQTSAENRACPYINIPEDNIRKQYLPDGTVRVTMRVSEVAIDSVIRHGCVVTRRPNP